VDGRIWLKLKLGLALELHFAREEESGHKQPSNLRGETDFRVFPGDFS
jgi:hypothetical protein